MEEIQRESERDSIFAEIIHSGAGMAKLKHQDMKPNTRKINKLLKELVRDPEYAYFSQAFVLEDAPEFIDEISNPINLSTIRDRNFRGLYEDVLDIFYQDMYLVFDNFIHQFPDNSEYHKRASDTKRLITDKLSNVMGSGFSSWLNKWNKHSDLVAPMNFVYRKIPDDQLKLLKMKVTGSSDDDPSLNAIRSVIRSQAHKLAMTFQATAVPSNVHVLSPDACVTVISMGRIYPLTSYASKKSIYPLGFTSRCCLQICAVFSQNEYVLPLRSIELTSRIADASASMTEGGGTVCGGKPSFQVRMGRMQLASDDNPLSAWQSVLHQCSEVIATLGQPLLQCRAVLNRLCCISEAMPFVENPFDIEVLSSGHGTIDSSSGCGSRVGGDIFGPVQDGSSEDEQVWAAIYSHHRSAVTSPMWLREVHRKLVEGCYDSEFEFAADIRLMCRNWTSTSVPKSETIRAARSFLKAFDSLFCQWVLNVRVDRLGVAVTGPWLRWQHSRLLDEPVRVVRGSTGFTSDKALCTMCGDVLEVDAPPVTSDSREISISVSGGCPFDASLLDHDSVSNHNADITDFVASKSNTNPLSSSLCDRCSRAGEKEAGQFNTPGLLKMGFVPCTELGPGWYHAQRLHNSCLQSLYIAPSGAEYGSKREAMEALDFEDALIDLIMDGGADSSKRDVRSSPNSTAQEEPLPPSQLFRGQCVNYVLPPDCRLAWFVSARHSVVSDSDSINGSATLLGDSIAEALMELTEQNLPDSGLFGLNCPEIRRSVECQRTVGFYDYEFDTMNHAKENIVNKANEELEKRYIVATAKVRLRDVVTNERWFWLEEGKTDADKALMNIVGDATGAGGSPLDGTVIPLFPGHVSAGEAEVLMAVWDFLDLASPWTGKSIFHLSELADATLCTNASSPCGLEAAHQPTRESIHDMVFDEVCCSLTEVLLLDLQQCVGEDQWAKYTQTHPLNTITWPYIAYSSLHSALLLRTMHDVKTDLVDAGCSILTAVVENDATVEIARNTPVVGGPRVEGSFEAAKVRSIQVCKETETTKIAKGSTASMHSVSGTDSFGEKVESSSSQIGQNLFGFGEVSLEQSSTTDVMILFILHPFVPLLLRLSPSVFKPMLHALLQNYVNGLFRPSNNRDIDDASIDYENFKSLAYIFQSIESILSVAASSSIGTTSIRDVVDIMLKWLFDLKQRLISSVDISAWTDINSKEFAAEMEAIVGIAVGEDIIGEDWLLRGQDSVEGEVNPNGNRLDVFLEPFNFCQPRLDCSRTDPRTDHCRQKSTKEVLEKASLARFRAHRCLEQTLRLLRLSDSESWNRPQRMAVLAALTSQCGYCNLIQTYLQEGTAAHESKKEKKQSSHTFSSSRSTKAGSDAPHSRSIVDVVVCQEDTWAWNLDTPTLEQLVDRGALQSDDMCCVFSGLPFRRFRSDSAQEWVYVPYWLLRPPLHPPSGLPPTLAAEFMMGLVGAEALADGRAAEMDTNSRPIALRGVALTVISARFKAVAELLQAQENLLSRVQALEAPLSEERKRNPPQRAGHSRASMLGFDRHGNQYFMFRVQDLIPLRPYIDRSQGEKVEPSVIVRDRFGSWSRTPDLASVVELLRNGIDPTLPTERRLRLRILAAVEEAKCHLRASYFELDSTQQKWLLRAVQEQRVIAEDAKSQLTSYSSQFGAVTDTMPTPSDANMKLHRESTPHDIDMHLKRPRQSLLSVVQGGEAVAATEQYTKTKVLAYCSKALAHRSRCAEARSSLHLAMSVSGLTQAASGNLSRLWYELAHTNFCSSAGDSVNRKRSLIMSAALCRIKALFASTTASHLLQDPYQAEQFSVTMSRSSYRAASKRSDEPTCRFEPVVSSSPQIGPVPEPVTAFGAKDESKNLITYREITSSCIEILTSAGLGVDDVGGQFAEPLDRSLQTGAAKCVEEQNRRGVLSAQMWIELSRRVNVEYAAKNLHSEWLAARKLNSNSEVDDGLSQMELSAVAAVWADSTGEDPIVSAMSDRMNEEREHSDSTLVTPHVGCEAVPLVQISDLPTDTVAASRGAVATVTQAELSASQDEERKRGTEVDCESMSQGLSDRQNRSRKRKSDNMNVKSNEAEEEDIGSRSSRRSRVKAVEQYTVSGGHLVRLHRSADAAAEWLAANGVSTAKLSNAVALACWDRNVAGGFRWKFYSGPPVDFGEIEQREESLEDLLQSLDNKKTPKKRRASKINGDTGGEEKTTDAAAGRANDASTQSVDIPVVDTKKLPEEPFCLVMRYAPTAVDLTDKTTRVSKQEGAPFPSSSQPVVHGFTLPGGRLLKLKAELMAVVYAVHERVLQWGADASTPSGTASISAASTICAVNSTLSAAPASLVEVSAAQKRSTKLWRRYHRREALLRFQHLVQTANTPQQVLDAMPTFESLLPAAALSKYFTAETLPSRALSCAALAARIFALDSSLRYEELRDFAIALSGQGRPNRLLLAPAPRCCIVSDCIKSLGHVPPCAPLASSPMHHSTVELSSADHARSRIHEPITLLGEDEVSKKYIADIEAANASKLRLVALNANPSTSSCGVAPTASSTVSIEKLASMEPTFSTETLSRIEPTTSTKKLSSMEAIPKSWINLSNTHSVGRGVGMPNKADNNSVNMLWFPGDQLPGTVDPSGAIGLSNCASTSSMVVQLTVPTISVSSKNNQQQCRLVSSTDAAHAHAPVPTFHVGAADPMARRLGGTLHIPQLPTQGAVGLSLATLPLQQYQPLGNGRLPEHVHPTGEFIGRKYLEHANSVGGVEDDVADEWSWSQWYAALQEYGQHHSSCNVPQGYEIPGNGKRLGRWLNNQRMAMFNGSLSPDRVSLLQELVDRGVLLWSFNATRRSW